jgi:acyl dehydratase
MTTYARGLYFDDFPLNEEYESPGRTITEADIVMFAGLSGDYNQLHTDAEFARATPFGARIAHGALVLSVATGLASRLGVIEGTALAFTGLTWKFQKPVFAGDTVRLRLKATKKRALGNEAGMVIAEVTIVNQRDEIVQSGEWSVLIARKGGGA